MKGFKTLILSLLVSVGLTTGLVPRSVQAHTLAFDNALYGAFYDGMRSSGYDTITSDCFAAFLTAGTKWHGEEGYEPPADHHAGDTVWEVIVEDHPFIQATLGLNCYTQKQEDKFGTSVNGHVWVDTANVCKSNSASSPECDLTERQRLTFVVAREIGLAYCYQQTGSNTCGYPSTTAECVADYYAHHLMEVPWSGDAYSYYTMCVVYGGMPA